MTGETALVSALRSFIESIVDEKLKGGSRVVQPPSDPKVEVDDSLKAKFEEARKAYPGSKRGLDTEWEYFLKCHRKKAAEFVPLLLPGIQEGIVYRQDLEKLKAKFIPQWKNFKTWIHQKCWEEKFPDKVFV